MTAQHPHPRLCPDCHVSLHPTAFHTLSLDVCPRCAGIWFDGGEFANLRAMGPNLLTELERSAVPEIRRQDQGTHDRWCPVCPRPLDRFAFATDSPISVDVCPECQGTWIPDGELERMETWTRLRRLPGFNRAPQPDVDPGGDLADIVQAHEVFLERAHALAALFRACGTRRRGGGWW